MNTENLIKGIADNNPELIRYTSKKLPTELISMQNFEASYKFLCANEVYGIIKFPSEKLESVKETLIQFAENSNFDEALDGLHVLYVLGTLWFLENHYDLSVINEYKTDEQKGAVNLQVIKLFQKTKR